MSVKRFLAVPAEAQTPYRRTHCVPARTRHYAGRLSQRLRILKVSAGMAAMISAGWGLLELWAAPAHWGIALINLVAATALALTPLLYRFGELIAPLAFVGIAYLTTAVVCWVVGTGSGIQFYFLAAASISVLILGVDRIKLAAAVAGVGASLTIALHYLVPADKLQQPAWLHNLSYVMVVVSACFMVVATVWFALREIARAEAAMEAEYERSEALLANILPTAVADRLKNPAVDVIADSYPDASVLFADIADFTRRASQTDPGQLVGFLNELYSGLDRLVDQHGLEKIKTSGDSYMVVSGVPDPRPDHLHALARLALDIAATIAGLRDPLGRPVSLRIGLATGPVVAGVVGNRRFFYDVWGDAVNLASRMESTGVANRIQVPQEVRDRLSDVFVLEERGDVDVKGKGVMRTWFLVGVRPRAARGPAGRSLSVTPAR
ncbi:adenylate/guanylate cyclase domain-containing protein [Mycolicibacter hiberniae]|uniref:Adenylate cyclase n=1 Tax=Mycolicibacter hiberniae TaxID=29314 RepID=A0A7I7X2S3_9MYCO|nr:adenylate/guanylate cyclase domain-containing protein [Mycolicibacter hiberniae]MCV7085265.1 adenylate/guanylate cyclase domain-containing protein [Mycolicibacter hiberniae]BBZ23163.1 adenylate cyclase [Mycolicibacter hiberniae]